MHAMLARSELRAYSHTGDTGSQSHAKSQRRPRAGDPWPPRPALRIVVPWPHLGTQHVHTDRGSEQRFRRYMRLESQQHLGT